MSPNLLSGADNPKNWQQERSLVTVEPPLLQHWQQPPCQWKEVTSAAYELDLSLKYAVVICARCEMSELWSHVSLSQKEEQLQNSPRASMHLIWISCWASFKLNVFHLWLWLFPSLFGSNAACSWSWSGAIVIKAPENLARSSLISLLRVHACIVPPPPPPHTCRKTFLRNQFLHEYMWGLYSHSREYRKIFSRIYFWKHVPAPSLCMDIVAVFSHPWCQQITICGGNEISVRIHVAHVFAAGRGWVQENIPGELFMGWFCAREDGLPAGR